MEETLFIEDYSNNELDVIFHYYSLYGYEGLNLITTNKYWIAETIELLEWYKEHKINFTPYIEEMQAKSWWLQHINKYEIWIRDFCLEGDQS